MSFQRPRTTAQLQSENVRRSLMWASPLAFLCGCVVGALAMFGWCGG